MGRREHHAVGHNIGADFRRYVVRRCFGASKGRLGKGRMQIILSLAAPALVLWWCSRKRYFAFGGSDWEFLVQSACVDRMTFPWVILFVYLLMIAFFIATVIWLKKKQTF